MIRYDSLMEKCNWDGCPKGQQVQNDGYIFVIKKCDGLIYFSI